MSAVGALKQQDRGEPVVEPGQLPGELHARPATTADQPRLWLVVHTRRTCDFVQGISSRKPMPANPATRGFEAAAPVELVWRRRLILEGFGLSDPQCSRLVGGPSSSSTRPICLMSADGGHLR
jgi:hypothetical protein